ncbi:hypothetical protein V2G26_009557 [Clonostachys chloroleuca]
MPASPIFVGTSSPVNHETGLRRSRFTYRQLSQLASYNTSNPLRVIAHIDLDAFYAQCEMVRLGVPKDQPLAVQQWQGLIAVNYAAREAGINRHCQVTEAKKLCPNLIAQHVATWREGDDKWAYRDDAAANIASDKVSLDPYRLESRKILSTINAALPPDQRRVEKASIDEVFMDLSAQVHSILLERFLELSGPPPYDDPTEKLPMPPTSALDWGEDALVGLDEDEEAIDPDWDDVVILIGSEIIRGVRARVWEELGYTCSGGVACNKLLSKLGSAFKKPNRQTVVRGRAIPAFLRDMKITKMRNLGGKMGDNVVSTFNTESIAELLEVPFETMRQKLGHETGTWIYNTIRGVDMSEVNSRTQIKSMLSAKSFRPSINTVDQAMKWLRIFAADIFARLVEEGVLEHKRRPKSINLHHRHAGQTYSRQASIPPGSAIDQDLVLNLAKNLLDQIISEHRVWPCANLSLTVGGFEESVKGNMGIGAFLVRGEEAEALNAAASVSHPPPTAAATPTAAEPDRLSKRARVEKAGIARFFTKRPPGDSIKGGDEPASRTPEANHAGASEASSPSEGIPKDDTGDEQALAAGVSCSRCSRRFDDVEELQTHQDWHMAKDLQDQERVAPVFASRPAYSRSSTPNSSDGPGRQRPKGKLEPGQKRLRFG